MVSECVGHQVHELAKFHFAIEGRQGSVLLALLSVVSSSGYSGCLAVLAAFFVCSCMTPHPVLYVCSVGSYSTQYATRHLVRSSRKTQQESDERVPSSPQGWKVAESGRQSANRTKTRYTVWDPDYYCRWFWDDDATQRRCDEQQESSIHLSFIRILSSCVWRSRCFIPSTLASLKHFTMSTAVSF